MVSAFKVNTGPGRLKTDYLAYEEVASVIGSWAPLRLPDSRRSFARGHHACHARKSGRLRPYPKRDDEHSTVDSAVFRLEP